MAEYVISSIGAKRPATRGEEQANFKKVSGIVSRRFRTL